MIKYLIPLSLVLLLAACNSNNSASKNQQAEDSTEVEEPYTDPVKQEISMAFPDAYRFFSARDSSFNPNRFEEASTDTANAPALKLSDALKNYYPLFIYSPDSSYAIDLYSYNVLLVKRNGKTVAETGDPDTEVALIDLKNKTRKRIYFGGSSSAVINARWINNQQFFLLTGEIISDSKFHPELLKYTVTDHTVNDFVYSDTLNLRISDYPDKRLENL